MISYLLLKENKYVSVKEQSYKYYTIRFTRDSLTLLCTPVSAVFVFAPKIENAVIVVQPCILG